MVILHFQHISGLATWRVLGSHMWLGAGALDSTGVNPYVRPLPAASVSSPFYRPFIIMHL